MRKLCEYFRINGVPILAPDAELPMQFRDAQSKDSSTDESGAMHRIIQKHKVGEWTFVYNDITEEEKKYMESLFPDDEYFEFEHPDRKDSNKKATCKAYRTSYGISWYNAVDGLWKNYKFTIMECVDGK